MKYCIGVITNQGKVLDGETGKLLSLPVRGTDSEGYPEVLIDATAVGGKGFFQRQSIKPYIGMTVAFTTNEGSVGFNFTIIKQNEKT